MMAAGVVPLMFAAMLLAFSPAHGSIPDLGLAGSFAEYAENAIPGWQLGGLALIQGDAFRLTARNSDSLGWLWSEEQASLGEWEMAVKFQIVGLTIRGAGGGLALWYTTTKGTGGSIYGHAPEYEGLGVFFDTYEGPEEENNNQPFVVAVINHGGQSHQVGVCFSEYRNRDDVKVLVRYKGGVLEVLLDVDDSGHYSKCLATEPDDERVRLPDRGHVGVTAATGVYADVHKVFSLTLQDLSTPQPELPHVPEAAQPGSGESAEGQGGSAYAQPILVAVGKAAEDLHRQQHPGELNVERQSDDGMAMPRPPEPRPKPVRPVGYDEEKVLRFLEDITEYIEEELDDLHASTARNAHSTTVKLDKILSKLDALAGASAARRKGEEAVEAMAEDVRAIRAIVERVYGAEGQGLQALTESLDAQLGTLTSALAKMDQERDPAAAGHESAQWRQTHATIESLQAMIAESTGKLHELQNLHRSKENEQASILTHIKGHLTDLGSSHKELEGKVGSDHWGMAKFLVCQMLFVAIFLFYKRATEFKDVKIL